MSEWSQNDGSMCDANEAGVLQRDLGGDCPLTTLLVRHQTQNFVFKKEKT